MRSLIPASLILVPLSVWAQPTRVLTPEVDEFIEGLLSRWGSPGGVGVAVVQLDPNGEWNIETKGYGVARLDDNSVVTDETLFPIGSNSKHFAAIAAGLLVTNESLTPRISWDTKIASLIPSWELVDPIASNESSIKDLMSHRTGLPRHDWMVHRDDTLPALIKRFKYLKPSTEFRETFQYNNPMYSTLGYLPEVVSTRTPLARYVKRNIFDPLGMNSTTFSFDVADATGHLSRGVARENLNLADGLPGTGIPRQLPFWFDKGGEDGNFLAGAGGIISNARDMATWLQSLLLLGEIPGSNETVIPSEVIEMTASGITPVSGGIPWPPAAQALVDSPMVYGGGQLISTYRGHRIVEHDGHVPGGQSRIARLPFENIGVALLMNDEDIGGDLNLIIQYRLLDEALGLEPFDWETAVEVGFGVFSDQPSPHTNASESSMPGGFASIEGTYSHPAYGNWSFCLFEPGNQPSDACKDFAANLSTILPGGVDPDIPTLIAPVDSVWFDYVRLQHFDGNVFNATLLSAYPTLNDTDQPFWTYPDTAPYLAEVGLSGDTVGLGFTGGFWGAGAGVAEPQGATLEERSEVWFEKVVES
ncbi:hypothetical protein PM082_017969 [Marasmius tenuissimus]|nr:hypothetical protein PM082_017969 [Marasmius tenuissimus]